MMAKSSKQPASPDLNTCVHMDVQYACKFVCTVYSIYSMYMQMYAHVRTGTPLYHCTYCNVSYSDGGVYGGKGVDTGACVPCS